MWCADVYISGQTLIIAKVKRDKRREDGVEFTSSLNKEDTFNLDEGIRIQFQKVFVTDSQVYQVKQEIEKKERKYRKTSEQPSFFICYFFIIYFHH